MSVTSQHPSVTPVGTASGTSQSLLRATDSAFETLLVRAVAAARWKRTTAADCKSWASPSANVAATAIEVDRRLSRSNLAVLFTVHRGEVRPSSSARETVEGMPMESPPEWATVSIEHEWLAVETPGRETYWVDLAMPPQATGQPNYSPLICSEPDAPVCYETAETTTATVAELATPDVWPIGTPTWPLHPPSDLPAVPTDGGVDGIDANRIIVGEARDELRTLPENSVDVVFTSPPYRLQRTYSGADAVWDASPDCEHEWERTELYTDTPIRASGGAGFNSSSDPDELRRERWRPSIRCSACGGWKGELGLEPTLQEYIDHLVGVFDEVERVLRPRGSLFVNIADSWADGHRTDDGEYRDAPRKALVGVPPAFEQGMRAAGWIVRERYAWVKPSPTPDPAHDRTAPAWEHVYRFVQQPDYYDSGDGLQTNVVEISTSAGKTDHNAMMPTELPRKVLERAIPPGGLVLDPFAGSGSVLVAATDHDADYLGIEISEEYADIAHERLAETVNGTRSPSGQLSFEAF